ncbi:MAG TPA: hypothetical protein PKD85_15450, partial [Saprospiraceae bacterium]|nr:hypothetical protein [Saprospiraceae bacterium]
YLWDGKRSPLTSLQGTAGGRRRGGGIPVLPGKYSVDISFFDGTTSKIVTNREAFEIKNLGWAVMPAKDIVGLKKFGAEVHNVSKLVNGTTEYLNHLQNKMKLLKSAALLIPEADINDLGPLNQIEYKINKINIEINGNSSLSGRQFETLPGIRQRLSTAMWSIYGHSSDIPTMQMKSLDLAKNQFKAVYNQIVNIDKELLLIQDKFRSIGMPSIAPELPKLDF